MPEPTDCLVVVDVQNDFCPGGALEVKRGDEILPLINQLARKFENVVLTPHLGSATRDTRVAMGMLCVEALRAVLLERRRPANAVGERPPP